MKYTHLFDESENVPAETLGNKGKQLSEMTLLGLPVPPGFVMSTELCTIYWKDDQKKCPAEADEEMHAAMKKIEEKTGKQFGGSNPLLVSVRSGGAVSMPGMMETILNVGLNDKTVKAMVEKTGDERFVYDIYRRLIEMFADTVLGVDRQKFEEVLDKHKKDAGALMEAELSADTFKKILDEYKTLFKTETGEDFPQDVWKQLSMARDAVYGSWNIPRAIAYRKANRLPDETGTAVNIQAMVFGNLDEKSLTGVGFTRNPATGENALYGEYLVKAQGEDIVAGIRTPKNIDEMKAEVPVAYEELQKIRDKLEKHYKDMQDFEFTVESGKLYMLQTRGGKRTAAAAVQIAVDMVNENLIDKKTAVMGIDPNSLNQLLHSQIDPSEELAVVATGLPASPGAATGKVVFTADEAEEMGEKGEKVILVRSETTPDDIHGILQSQGVLTARGGMTSHAAVVARGMGMPCVAGCDAIKIDIAHKTFVAGDKAFKEGDILSLDGATGRVIEGKVKLIEPELSGAFKTILEWADEFKKMKVFANADTPVDSKKAKELGAEGIGLCRTEHMFFAEDRIPHMRAMIMAESKKEREEALEKLLPMQREDFYGLFKVMNAQPVIIRFLDPPLHEFLPHLTDLLVEAAVMKEKGETGPDFEKKQVLIKKVQQLEENNPMLGHRGVRLGVTYPEVYEMQARAIFEAACDLVKEGLDPRPRVEIPLVADWRELKMMRKHTEKIAEKVFEEKGTKVDVVVGTMIEVPRACVTADQIAKVADFLSFGTNDLTQMTFGFSRDDAEGKFFKEYIDHKIMPVSPFVSIDRDGVGALMKMCVDNSRKTKSDMPVGICGEQGGEPHSVEFCHMIGLNDVSCSPFRVPIARLSAAQAAIKHGA